MPKTTNTKPEPATSILTSGWTPKELATLERLVEEYGTDRSKLLRQLVRNASTMQTQVIDKLEKAGN
jgi:hypothetical protein